MATKKQFIDRATQLGLEIEDDGTAMTITAPDGKVFATYFTRYETIQYDYDGWTKAQAYERMIEIMKDGLTTDEHEQES